MTYRFTWIPIYEELADRLVDWENRQTELIAFIQDSSIRWVKGNALE